MNDASTIELPAEVYKGLLQVARESGTTPADWIASRLPPPSNGSSTTRDSGDVADANARLRAAMIDLGSPTGTDNEQIDADLVRAYVDEHA